MTACLRMQLFKRTHEERIFGKVAESTEEKGAIPLYINSKCSDQSKSPDMGATRPLWRFVSIYSPKG
jgi:hypothetical protein